tara:strand:+ start:1758 stop:2024 length:267 start_codon:yes stop_codon:yes gene_type:complete
MNSQELQLFIEDLLPHIQEQNVEEYFDNLKRKIGFQLIGSERVEITPEEKNIAEALMRYVRSNLTTRFQSLSMTEDNTSPPVFRHTLK